MTPTLALLLKAPHLATVKTRLAATLGPARALAIYRALAERQLRALPPAWPVTIHFTPAGAPVEAELRAWLTPLRPGESPPALGPAYRPQPDGDLGVRLTAALFAGIAWSTPAVLAQTRTRLHTAGLRVSELPVLPDLDTDDDWHRAVSAGLLGTVPP